MLGKFIGLRRGGYIEPPDLLHSVSDESLLEAARRSDGLSSVTLLATSGSSGFFFSGLRDGRRRFLKTHRTLVAGDNLRKEFGVLFRIYSERLRPLLHHFCLDEEVWYFLEMDYVENGNLADVRPDSMSRLIDGIAVQFQSANDIEWNYNAHSLHALAAPAIEELSAAHLLEPSVIRTCEDSARRFLDYVDSESVVCHGDFGNENVRILGKDMLVLDWEDAMVGPRFYDILYWLSFLAQRRYYSASLLGELGIPRQYGVDVMVVIVLLKSYLAFLKGLHAGFRLSVSDRIREIVDKL